MVGDNTAVKIISECIVIGEKKYLLLSELLQESVCTCMNVVRNHT